MLLQLSIDIKVTSFYFDVSEENSLQEPFEPLILVLLQEAFSHLLAEQNELTQELASQGLSVVYELGDASMKKSLVNALVGTLTGSGKRKRAVKV